VEQEQAIRSGVTASVVVHLSVLAMILISTEVHPHRSAAEPIAVDIVAPSEIAKAEPETEPEKKQLTLPDLSALSQKEPAPPPPQSAEPRPKAPQVASSPQPASPKEAPSRQAALPATQGPSPAQPDVTVKYNVMLGLPAEQPVPPAPPEKSGKPDDGFDATASSAANLKSSVISEFKRHLKTCSKLPDGVAPTDHLVVKLRVFMTHDGRLAAEPAIGGGSANIKAINLLQSAIAALKDCQPYTMLPAERYGEWKVLDLDFTPKDFLG
jgi:hypothetical protein